MRLFRQNGLTIALVLLFSVSLVGQAATGWGTENAELLAHGQPALGLVAYGIFMFVVARYRRIEPA